MLIPSEKLGFSMPLILGRTTLPSRIFASKKALNMIGANIGSDNADVLVMWLVDVGLVAIGLRR
jgi:hypothetical protein